MNPLATIKDFVSILSTSSGLNKEVRDLLEKKALLLKEEVILLTQKNDVLSEKNALLETENTNLKAEVTNLQEQLKQAALPRGPVSPSIQARPRRDLGY